MELHRGRLIDHFELRCIDLAASKRFYAAVLGGERRYHPGYYAAFVLDPDGNNIEAVHHGEATRSVPSVVITPRMSDR